MRYFVDEFNKEGFSEDLEEELHTFVFNNERGFPQEIKEECLNSTVGGSGIFEVMRNTKLISVSLTYKDTWGLNTDDLEESVIAILKLKNTMRLMNFLEKLKL